MSDPRRAAGRVLPIVLPECFVCDDCGPFVRADEDGCCAMCGKDAKVRKTKGVLAGLRRSEA